MKKALAAIAGLLLIMCCGCSTGYREIERGYMVTAVGIHAEENKIQIILETLSSSDREPGSESIKILYGEGDNLNRAFGSIKKSLVKSLYFEHCGVIALDSDFTDSEISKILDFCNDLETLNIDVYVVRTHNTAALFETEAAYKSIGYSVIELTKNTGANGSVSNQLYNVRKRYSSGENFKLPVVTVKNNTLVLE